MHRRPYPVECRSRDRDVDLRDRDRQLHRTWTVLAEQAAAEPDSWAALTGFIENLLTRLAADRGLLEAFTGDHPAAAQLAQACARGMTHLSTVLDRARRDETLRADATDDDVVNLVWALSLLGENAGESAWRRSLPFVLDGLGAS